MSVWASPSMGGKMRVQTMELLLGTKRQMTARAMSEPAESETGAKIWVSA